jgi:hypothetical protein
VRLRLRRCDEAPHYHRQKRKDKTVERSKAEGARIIADNKSKAEAATMNAVIAKITMKFKITLLRPIPSGRQAMHIHI